MTGRRAWSDLFSSKFGYILGNVLVSALAFGRNLFFMKSLGLADIGQVALMQTIVMLVGFSQLGLINGGYRLYAIGDSQQNESINNTLFTFFFALGLLTLLLLAGGMLRIGAQTANPETVAIGVSAGVATLVSTWINSTLIARRKLGESNLINLMAVSLSLGIAVLSAAFGLMAALASMFVQPACVVLLALVLRRQNRPNRVQFEFTLIRRIMELGFIPFAAGIFLLLHFQIERWAIVYVLGPVELGRFYLVILYTTVSLLVPVSLLNLYFPRTIAAFEEGRHADFLNLFRRHIVDLLAYLACVIILTITLLPWLLNHYFDNYRGGETLIYLVIPGVIAQTLCDPASLVFNSSRKLRPVLIYGVLLLLTDVAILYFLYSFNLFTLETVVIAKSVAHVLAFSYLASVLALFRKNFFHHAIAT